jgi:hypothetical protein
VNDPDKDNCRINAHIRKIIRRRKSGQSRARPTTICRSGQSSTFATARPSLQAGWSPRSEYGVKHVWVISSESRAASCARRVA